MNSVELLKLLPVFVFLLLLALLAYAILRVHLLRKQLSQLQQKYTGLLQQLDLTSQQVKSKGLSQRQRQKCITSQSEDNH